MVSTWRRARSSVTGRFVKLRWALRHPKHSVIETVRRIRGG